jgi:hypothetical protein
LLQPNLGEKKKARRLRERAAMEDGVGFLYLAVPPAVPAMEDGVGFLGHHAVARPCTLNPKKCDPSVGTGGWGGVPRSTSE